jgi:hypothetical protein
MGKKSAPKAPDPFKVSAAEAKASKDVAQFNQSMNMVNQTSPFGSVSYTNNGVDPVTGAPRYSQSTALSPQLQALFDSQTASQQGISDAVTGAVGRLPTQAFDSSGIDVGDIRKRSMDSQLALLNPEFDKSWKNLETTMSNRGIPIGAEIFNDQLGEFNRAKDSALLGAARTADQDAGNEFQRQYGNKWQEYNAPYTALSSLMGNSQSVQNPSFGNYPTASAQAPNVGQNIWNKYNADQQNYQNQQGQMFNGALGLGQLGLAMFSDRRLKRDIKRIGEMPSGLPVYSYRYIWSDEPQIGVMAQEALGMIPDAVLTHPSGFLMVDYSRIH